MRAAAGEDVALVVRAAGPGCSVQDGGRFGYARYGVTAAGPMDAVAHAAANRALGNPPDAAGIEVSLGGIELTAAGAPLRLACAGGAFRVSLDGVSLPSAVTLLLEPGAVLAIRPGEAGAWCSVAVAGRLDLAPVLGSCATHARAGIGGLDGRMLAAGDRIGVIPAAAARCAPPEALVVPWLSRPPGVIRVLLGPQDDFFAAEAIAAFCAGPWTVGANSDRMAWLLQGEPLRHARGYNIVSDGVVMGAIQVPGEGLPFVLMADCQPTGGYPKIATVIGADLGRLAQARPGTRLRFKPVTYAAAVAARREQAELLARTPAREALPRRSFAAAALRRLPLAAGVLGPEPVPPADSRTPGRLATEERLAVLLDAGSFAPLPAAPAAVRIGTGRIAGRAVRVAAQESGEACTPPAAAAIGAAARAAAAAGEPLVVLFDSPGVRLADGAASLAGIGGLCAGLCAPAGVPRIGVAMGPLPGIPALAAGLVDFLVMVGGAGPLAVASPEIVRGVHGETVADAELGGGALHAERTGLAALLAANEIDALRAVRRLFAFLPWWREGRVAPVESFDRADRESPFLDLLAREPDGVDTMEAVLRAIVDEGAFLELAPGYGGSLRTGLGRLDGFATGFLASEPKVLGGALDCAALAKATRFVALCARLSLPIVTLVDCPGLLPGAAEAAGGQLLLAAALARTTAEARVAKVGVIAGAAFGPAAVLLGARALGAAAVFAWPGAQVAPLPPEAAAALACPAERDDPERLAAHTAVAAVALSAAAAVAAGVADAQIAPRATRRHLIAALAAARGEG
jgi:biotin-dependent carboxylase-like uncharacterized protein